MGHRILGSNSWGHIESNVDSTRPTANFGTSVTPAQNSYGSYVSLISAVAYDCYWVEVNINSGAAINNARDLLVTIGVDPSGGTSYQALIPDLLGSNASVYADTSGALCGGHSYAFPLFVKAGSQLAAAASVNNASVGTVRVVIRLYGRPSRPELIQYGTSVEAVGITAASSSGTSVAPGTTSDGTWTSLGTSSRRCFYWQLGVGINDATMGGGGGSVGYNAELSVGDGTNQIRIIPDVGFVANNSESFCMTQGQPQGWRDVPAGGTLYGRLQCAGTSDSNLSMAAYGVRK